MMDPQPFTIADFFKMLREGAQARMSLPRYVEFLRHEGEGDKYFREEYLPIGIVLSRHMGIDEANETETIILGNEAMPWDAKLGSGAILEVVQALPRGEHKVRREVGGGLDVITFLQHAGDHLQFPDAIIQAIDHKHGKRYSDSRILIVSFSGDYSGEEDEVVFRWIAEIRRRTHIGTFQEIVLVEMGRNVAFQLFPH